MISQTNRCNDSQSKCSSSNRPRYHHRKSNTVGLCQNPHKITLNGICPVPMETVNGKESQQGHIIQRSPVAVVTAVELNVAVYRGKIAWKCKIVHRYGNASRDGRVERRKGGRIQSCSVAIAIAVEVGCSGGVA